MTDKSWKPLLQAVRKVLWEVWDPIGVNDHVEAVGEYDSYAASIVSLLIHDCSAPDLDRQLSRLETDDMGLPARSSGDRAPVVAALLALRGEDGGTLGGRSR
jgi:hypothetical protein